MTAIKASYLDFFGAGATGTGFAGTAFAEKFSLNILTVGDDGRGLTSLLLSGMEHDVFRQKLWQAYYLADFNVRFWLLYESRVGWISKCTKAILALASVFSVVAFMSSIGDDKLVISLAVLSGLISSVFIPAFGLEGFLGKVIGIRNRWIDVRNGFESIWDEIDSSDDLPRLKKEFVRWNKIDTELEQSSDWLPKPSKMLIRAQSATDQMLVSYLC